MCMDSELLTVQLRNANLSDIDLGLHKGEQSHCLISRFPKENINVFLNSLLCSNLN